MGPTFDALVIGAGPAGLFAARELGAAGLKVLIVEKGKGVGERGPKDIMSGVGGAGTYSDGTMNLRPDIGGDLTGMTGDPDRAWDLVHEVARVFRGHGMPEPAATHRDAEVELERLAASVGVRFSPIVQSHIGSDRAPEVILSFQRELESMDVRFRTRTEVTDFMVEREGECTGVVTADGERIPARRTLLATGRVGMPWVQRLTRRGILRSAFAPIDIGVRVEVPHIIMDRVIAINRDPKFHLLSPTYDDHVRTFCTNHRGFVVKEEYEDFIGVNGHSCRDRFSENTNFAFLVKNRLTKPQEDTTRYGWAIAQLATTIGGGKPIVQRLGDLGKGQRSTDRRLGRNTVRPTLTEYTPGDISMALPHRIVVDLVECLKMLSRIIPGVDSPSTLLYAPEIKFYANQLEVSRTMETSIRHLYAAGDGAGVSHDIVNAAATGILAARGMIESL